MYIRPYGSVNQSYLLQVVDLEGLPVDTLTAATIGLKIVIATPAGVDELTPVTLASLATPHTDRGFLHVQDAVYRVDLPDTYQEDLDFVVWMSGTDIIGLKQTVTLLRPAASLGVSPITPVPNAGQLQVRRGDTYSVTLEGLGNISDRTELWFTAKTTEQKDAATETDEAAIVQVAETTGLVTANGEALTPDKASITVTNEVTGTIDIVLDEEVTFRFPIENLHFDVQVRRDDGSVSTLGAGRYKVVADVTRRTS